MPKRIWFGAYANEGALRLMREEVHARTKRAVIRVSLPASLLAGIVGFVLGRV